MNHADETASIDLTVPHIPGEVSNIVVDEENLIRKASLTDESDAEAAQIQEAAKAFSLALKHPAVIDMLKREIAQMVIGALMMYGVIKPPGQGKLFARLMTTMGNGENEAANMIINRLRDDAGADPTGYEALYINEEGQHIAAQLDEQMAEAIHEMYVSNDLQTGTQYLIQLGYLKE